MIWFLFLEGKSPSEIKNPMVAVYGDSSPSMAALKKWFHKFNVVAQRCLMGLADAKDNITIINDSLSANHQLKVRATAETVAILKDCGVIFCTKYWIWESCGRDACHIFSLWTTNAIMRPLHIIVWRCLSAMWINFCVFSSRPTKHGSTGIYQRQRSSDFHAANLLQRRQILSYRRKGHAPISGFTRCGLPAVPGEGKNVHRALLCGSNEWIIEKTTTSEVKITSPPWQCLSLLFGHIFWIRLRTAYPSTTFPIFADLQRTYFLDGLKKFEDSWVKCIVLKEDYVEK